MSPYRNSFTDGLHVSRKIVSGASMTGGTPPGVTAVVSIVLLFFRKILRKEDIQIIGWLII